MYRKILVPLDGSKLAEAALRHARAFAHCTGAELVLLRIVSYSLHDLIVTDPTFSSTLTEDLLAIRHRAESYLEETAAVLRRDGLRVRTEVYDDSRAADAILDYADSHQVDLIIISTHGRSGVTRWLLGSVADRIVQGARAPVLLVRGCSGGNPDAAQAN